MNQVWRTLVLLYPVLDARYGSGEQRGRARRVMKRDERAAVTAVVETLPGMVAAWSDGLASLEPFDVVEVRRSIRSLSSSGGGRWWVGPREVRPELESIAEVGAAYDSVYALWPGDPSVPQCGWGCSLGPSEATFNAGFSSISTDHWATLLTDPDPAQGYIHEWLHQVEAVYRALGASEAELPTLHDAAAFTSTRPVDEAPFGRSYAEYHDGGARTWAPWYRDWMTGRLAQIDPTTTADDTAVDDTAADGTTDLTATDGRTDATTTDGTSSAAGSPRTGPIAITAASPIRLASASPIGLTPGRWALRKSPGNPVSSD